MEEGNLQIFMGEAPASLLPEPEPEPEEEETADAEEPEEVARIPMMEEDEVEKLEQQLDFQEVKPHPLLPLSGLGPLPLPVSRDFDAKFLIEVLCCAVLFEFVEVGGESDRSVEPLQHLRDGRGRHGRDGAGGRGRALPAIL